MLKKRSRGTTVVGEASFKIKSGGWNYTANDKSAKPSMTAAGVSSLLVARNGLGASDAGLRRAVEKAIVRSYAWITNNFAKFMSLGGGNHGLYTIYSLEKVGDLGDIEKFGGHDWYVEGSNTLLGAQKGDGSWGGGYVDTSFALLFLTRATRLKPYAAPKITTRAQGKTGEEIGRGLVYLDRLGGFVNAKEILMILGDSRDSTLVSVGQQVVGNYNRSQLEDLVPELLGLWTRSNDRISRFARESLEEITGLSSKQRSDYESWVTENSAVSALSKKSSVTVEEISALLDKTSSPVLKGRLVDIANRKQLYVNDQV